MHLSSLLFSFSFHYFPKVVNAANPIESTLPMSVFKKLINSFVAQGCLSFCKLAPSKLSIFVARKAATNTCGTNPHDKKLRPTPAAAMMIEPTTPARVPSREIAPSVPGGTGLRVVMRKVRFP